MMCHTSSKNKWDEETVGGGGRELRLLLGAGVLMAVTACAGIGYPTPTPTPTPTPAAMNVESPIAICATEAATDTCLLLDSLGQRVCGALTRGATKPETGASNTTTHTSTRAQCNITTTERVGDR